MSKLNDQPVTLNGGFIRFPEVAAAGQSASNIGYSAQETPGTPGKYDTIYTEPVDAGYQVETYFGPSIDGAEVDQGGYSTLAPGQTAVLTEDVTRTSTGTFTGTNYFWVYIVDSTSGVVSSSYYYGAITISPVLSSATGVANGATGYTGSVVTTSDTGTLYWYVSASATPPSATDLKAGTSAVDSGSQTVTGTGTQNVSGSGLTASNSYYIHYLHNVSGTDSAIVTSAQFTTAAAATAPSAFVASDWDLIAAASSGGTVLQIDIQTLPNDGGSAITDIEYRLDGGTATSLSTTTTGLYNITVTADTETDVEIRAVNAVGNGAWSDLKTATPQRSGGSTVSSFQIDGRTFTLNGTYSIVRHIDGPVCIVSSSAVGVTPPSASSAGRDGVMINPQYSAASGSQGYDSDRPNYSSGLNVVGSETSLSPGDIMVATKSSSVATTSRSGYTESYQCVYVSSTAPSADSLAPAMIGWSSRTEITLESAPNWSSLVSSIPTYTVTGGNQPTYASIIAGLNFNPGWAQYRYASSQGYEWACPYAWGGPQSITKSSNMNYGYSIIARMSESLAALMDNSYSTAERQEILVRLASAGKQLSETLEGAGQTISPDGGHFQAHPICVFIYYWVTGQSSKIDSLLSDFGGNWRQVIEADATYVSNLSPFGSASNLTDWSTYPTRQWTYHRRTFTRSGNTMTAPVRRTGSQGDEQKGRWRGLVVTDGTNTALITADNSGDRGTTDTVSIDVDDATGFASSFVGWMTPDYTISAGDPVWGIRGAGRYNSIIPTIYTNYWEVQHWAASFLFIYAVGEMRDNLLIAADFVDQSCQSNVPTAAQDWPSHIDSGTNHEALWNQHQATIYAISQPNLT